MSSTQAMPTFTQTLASLMASVSSSLPDGKSQLGIEMKPPAATVTRTSIGHAVSEPPMSALATATTEVVVNSHPTTSMSIQQQARLPPVDGTRLWLLVGVLCFALFLSALEQNIVGASLITISQDLGRYNLSSWIVNSYLLSYNGFLIIFARSSDIFGRRSAFLTALVIFTVASAACGAAQSMLQLIVFRAFQGIGSAGLFTLTMSTSTEIPGKARSIISGLISGVFGIAAGTSPVLGGAIVSHTTWRWIFLLNVPICVPLIIMTFLVFPKNLSKLEVSQRAFGQVDWIGAALYITAVITLNFGLTEGGIDFAWQSAAIIVPLTISGLSWVAFVAWEIRLTAMGSRSQVLPLWPTRLLKNRVAACAMFTAILSGIPLYSSYTYFPQRFELINTLSPVQAGLRMLVLAWFSFFATGLSAALCTGKNLSYPILVASMALQSIGLGLISALPGTEAFPPQLYAYLIILGAGFGLSLPTVSFIVRMEVTHLDHAVHMAAISSLRSLGGTIGISVGNIVLSSQVWSKLQSTLSVKQLAQVRQSKYNTNDFTPSEIAQIRTTFVAGFDFNTRLTMYFGIAAFLVSIGCFVRNPLQVRELDEKENAERKLLDSQTVLLSVAPMPSLDAIPIGNVEEAASPQARGS